MEGPHHPRCTHHRGLITLSAGSDFMLLLTGEFLSFLTTVDQKAFVTDNCSDSGNVFSFAEGVICVFWFDLFTFPYWGCWFNEVLDCSTASRVSGVSCFEDAQTLDAHSPSRQLATFNIFRCHLSLCISWGVYALPPAYHKFKGRWMKMLHWMRTDRKSCHSTSRIVAVTQMIFPLSLSVWMTPESISFQSGKYI